jgi:phage terminase large subunit-like protein
MIEETRVEKGPDMVRIVVAINPSITDDKDFSETGIVVAGRGFDGHAYVFRDLSCRLSSNGWGKLAIDAYREFSADRIVTEVDKGGDLVEGVLRAIYRNVSFKAVRAPHGRIVRAEAISNLYRRRKVHHVGLFTKLEAQMNSYNADSLDGPPERVDALVLALIELMFRPPGEGLAEDPEDHLVEIQLRGKP